MRRQKRPEPLGPARQGFHHQPFRELAKRAPVLRRAAKIEPVREPEPTAPPADDDAGAFAREMAGVTPLSAAERVRVPRLPPVPKREISDPDDEVIDALNKLVDGSGSFDIADTTEYVEGAVLGLDRRLLRRLRSGDFAHQSHLDLHGMNSEEARAAVDRFLAAAQRRGHRCVLIVHGRGRNSKDQVPVLKRRLTGWLSRSTWARYVLAFASARPCDGGVGALYVLLRRQRAAKRPIQVTEGAKW